MKLLHGLALALAGAAIAMEAAGRPKGLPCKYEVVILEPPPVCVHQGELYSPSAAAKAINDLGQAAGDQYFCTPPNSKPFRWDSEHGYQVLPPVPGEFDAQTLDINNLGWLVGEAEIVGQGMRGFVHVPVAGYITLDVLPGHHWSSAAAINDSLQIVGYSANVQTGPMHAVMWSPDGLVDVGAIIGGPDSVIADIANDGTMTGWLGNSQIFDGRAFILTGPSADALTVLGPIPGGFTSEGRAINSRHDIAGIGRAPDPQGIYSSIRHSFAYFDAEFHMIDGLPGCPHTIATGINDDRFVIGYLYSDCNRGWVWADGEQRDLNDMIDPGPEEIEIYYPQSINSSGVIAAEANSRNGLLAVLLYPVYVGAADLDHNCAVDSTDLALLLAAWGPCPRAPGSCPADLDGSGAVNGFDLAMLLGQWSAD